MRDGAVSRLTLTDVLEKRDFFDWPSTNTPWIAAHSCEGRWKQFVESYTKLMQTQF